jgi:hypothetical protein
MEATKLFEQFSGDVQIAVLEMAMLGFEVETRKWAEYFDLDEAVIGSVVNELKRFFKEGE